MSGFSTLTEEEVEDVVQAKDEVVVLATKIKASNNNRMMHMGQTHVDMEIIEARGVKEVAKFPENSCTK